MMKFGVLLLAAFVVAQTNAYEPSGALKSLADQVGSLSGIRGATDNYTQQLRFAAVMNAIKASTQKGYYFWNSEGRRLLDDCKYRTDLNSLEVEVCRYVPSGYTANKMINSKTYISQLGETNLVADLNLQTSFGKPTGGHYGSWHDREAIIDGVKKQLRSYRARYGGSAYTNEQAKQNYIDALDHVCNKWNPARRAMIHMIDLGYPVDESLQRELISVENNCNALNSVGIANLREQIRYMDEAASLPEPAQQSRKGPSKASSKSWFGVRRKY